MASSANPTPVVAITTPGGAQEQITTALASQADFQVVEVLATFKMLSQHIHAAQPEIIIIDCQMDREAALDALDELSGQYPGIALVAILPSEDMVMAQQVTLAGARAFIAQPFTQVNLLNLMRRVRDLESRRRLAQPAASPAAAAASSDAPVRVLAVFSPRGGVGCTTIAANLAMALLAETGQRVLLVEGKLFFGHLGLMLNLRVPNSIADLVPHASALEDAVVHDVVVEHVSGVQVLLAPHSMEVAQGIRPDALYNILSGLRRMYDYIVVDVGSALNENAVTMMDVADRVLLVTQPELAALHDASRFIQLSRSLAYPTGKILTVLNRVGLEGGVRQADIESVVNIQAFAHIPDDEGSVLRSINRGIPLVLRYPRSPVSRTLQHMARELIRMGHGDESLNAPAPAKGKAKPRAARASAG